MGGSCQIKAYFCFQITLYDKKSPINLEELLQTYIKGKSKRNWVSAKAINTGNSMGGLGFFKKFTQALKSSFVMRYVRKADDHWCDRVDQSLKLTPDTKSWTRETSSSMG